MRILLVSHRFPPDGIGGVERNTQTLAADLVRAGDSVAILTRRATSTQQDRMLHERLPDGSSVYRVVAGHINLERFLERHERLEQFFTAAVLETRPDVVHFNHLLGFSPRSIQIAQRLGARTVMSLHDFYAVCPRVHLQKPAGDLCAGPDGGRECALACFPAATEQEALRWRFRNLYFESAVSTADALIAYSEHVASYFQHFSTIERPVRVVPNGVPANLRRAGELRRRPTHKRLRIGYFGTVVLHKGPHIILQALRLAELPSVDLVVAGHAPSKAYLNRLREEAKRIPGLEFRVFGDYEPKELAVLMQDFDCIVVPSLVPEAGPIVPREALAAGVPVIAARIGALPELIDEGQNGFTFEPNQPSGLACILRKLAKDVSLRLHLQAGALDSPMISTAEHAARIRSVYQDVLQSAQTKVTAGTNSSQFQTIHQALLQMGFDRPVSQR